MAEIRAVSAEQRGEAAELREQEAVIAARTSAEKCGRLLQHVEAAEAARRVSGSSVESIMTSYGSVPEIIMESKCG
jgi:mevalonate pyrophosphate decarboxylase